MFLIMSAAYVGQELESEFGKIPPSFLPLGNKRLFQYQVKSAPVGAKIYLSIPSTFVVTNNDMQWLKNNNVGVIYNPENLSLGASLVAALNLAEYDLDNGLEVLFGDTLIQSIPSGDNIVGISEVKDSYRWAFCNNSKSEWLEQNNGGDIHDTNYVVNGYFKFNQPRQLVKSITSCKWSFLDGLNHYHDEIGLKSVKIDGWLDFGHVNTYYKSKAEFTTQRAFNELTITTKWIEKSSINQGKIEAESHWFKSIPSSLRVYTPQYLGELISTDKYSYKLEYLYHTALNELFVFGELPSIIWKQIFASCFDFIDDCRDYKSAIVNTKSTFNSLFLDKTKDRVDEYCKVNDLSLEREWDFNGDFSASINEVLKISQSYLPKEEICNSVMHGDFCFSNILYDFRACKIKTIDPRGITNEGECTIYGDYRYDIAKLSHSILGLYDWIIAGYYQVDISDYIIRFHIEEPKGYERTSEIFIAEIAKRFDLNKENLYAMQIQLFISMLPLHADDVLRQKALFSNAFRLYEKLLRIKV
tara:strand:+ start:1848 stop:3434 length:1587 start_codon:yes stop_codon:yes gene_type:complete